MHPWTLERPKTILTKMGSQSALTTMYMDTWQRIAKIQRKRKIQKSAINMTRYSTLPKTADQDRRRRIAAYRMNQIMKRITNRRILEKVPSKYSIKN